MALILMRPCKSEMCDRVFCFHAVEHFRTPECSRELEGCPGRAGNSCIRENAPESVRIASLVWRAMRIVGFDHPADHADVATTLLAYFREFERMTRPEEIKLPEFFGKKKEGEQ